VQGREFLKRKEHNMSEQDNLQLVQEGFGDFGRGDIQSLLGKFADDIEWVIPGTKNSPLAGTYKGTARVAEFFKQLSELTELTSFEPLQFVAQGDTVVALGREAGRTRASGRPFEANWAMVFTVGNGKIVRFQEYTNTAALEAAFTGAQSASA
jgi:ketosteroid isomerase-like protein